MVMAVVRAYLHLGLQISLNARRHLYSVLSKCAKLYDTKHRCTETESFCFLALQFTELIPLLSYAAKPRTLCPPVIFPTDSYRTLWLCVSVFNILILIDYLNCSKAMIGSV